jgi:hypothetical protein
MKKDDLLLWLLVAALLAGILITVFFAPRRSRHGYGAVGPGEPSLTFAEGLGYR